MGVSRQVKLPRSQKILEDELVAMVDIGTGRWRDTDPLCYLRPHLEKSRGTETSLYYVSSPQHMYQVTFSELRWIERAY